MQNWFKYHILHTQLISFYAEPWSSFINSKVRLAPTLYINHIIKNHWSLWQCLCHIELNSIFYF